MRTIICAFSLLLYGCASVGVTRVDPGGAKPNSCQLDIYTSEEEVEQEFEVACLIDSRTGSTLFHSRNAAAAIEKAKPEACKCGADAILIVSSDTEGVTLSGWGQGKALIRAIRYTASDQSQD